MRFDRDRPLGLAVLSNSLDRLIGPERHTDHHVGAGTSLPAGCIEEFVDLRGGKADHEGAPRVAISSGCAGRLIGVSRQSLTIGGKSVLTSKRGPPALPGWQ
jgi:hypothetical protein